MPRVTKEAKSEKPTETKKETKKKTTATTKKTTTATKKKSTSVAKKTTTKKKATAVTKKTTKSTKKATGVTAKKVVKKSKSDNSLQSVSTLEYYDLPYRYNQTLVKILAQTPSVLFVYWDISDIDRINFIKNYGDDFFNRTKPVLIVHNKTKNSSFEVEINDFANCWYLRMQESDCEYELELGRRDITNPSQYMYISSSNELISPNDHILFEKTDFTNIKFKNVKTGHLSTRDFGSIRLMTNIGSIYNKKHKIYNFYNDLYKDVELENNKMFFNPSSSNPTSGMF